jgi:hypothetical protein
VQELTEPVNQDYSPAYGGAPPDGTAVPQPQPPYQQPSYGQKPDGAAPYGCGPPDPAAQLGDTYAVGGLYGAAPTYGAASAGNEKNSSLRPCRHVGCKWLGDARVTEWRSSASLLRSADADLTDFEICQVQRQGIVRRCALLGPRKLDGERYIAREQR